MGEGSYKVIELMSVLNKPAASGLRVSKSCKCAHAHLRNSWTFENKTGKHILSWFWHILNIFIYVYIYIYIFPAVPKLTLMSFFESIIGPFFCSFVVVILCISPTHMWRVKGTFWIKILVFSLPAMEFCHFRTPEKFPKT